MAVEGAMLTMIGKVSYNLETDQFAITDGLGLIGGGFHESLSFLQSQLKAYNKIGTTLLVSVLTSLAIVGSVWLTRYIRA